MSALIFTLSETGEIGAVGPTFPEDESYHDVEVCE